MGFRAAKTTGLSRVGVSVSGCEGVFSRAAAIRASITFALFVRQKTTERNCASVKLEVIDFSRSQARFLGSFSAIFSSNARNLSCIKP